MKNKIPFFFLNGGIKKLEVSRLNKDYIYRLFLLHGKAIPRPDAELDLLRVTKR